MVQALGCLFEILRPGLIDVLELLGIPVDEREPAALHLDHDAVTLLESVADIGHPVLNFCDLSRDEGLRI